ncbi:ATP-dependent helicase [Candidatus Woesearchaeota archaeon]|nr:ATP-dependent helicase [Candidatus Woesearchaeota archaeon]
MEKPFTRSQNIKILNPTFKKWFFSNFEDFTEPQKYSIYTIHSRENILVSSPTGSGKTLSAFGAILNELVDLDEKDKLEDKIYCVYISPLKALSNDIERNLLSPLKEIQELSEKELKLRVGVRTGDTSQSDKVKMTKNPPHILITTPESLAIMLSSPKFRDNLKDVQWTIVDEIHSLAENKRGVHLSLSLERLQELSPGMTRVGLSATVSPLDKVANYLVGTNRKCKIVDVQYIKEYDFEVLSPVEDFMNVSQEHLHEKLYELINKLIQEHKTTLVFTNTRAATERIVHNLKNKFPKQYKNNIENEDEVYSTIGAHHGSLSKKHRLDLENNLKQGKMKCVVCSTSLELGIDIGSIDLVICLGSPKSVARLLQRAGRAGHSIHKETKARIIVLDRDDLIECSVMVKSALEKKIDRIHIPKNCLDVLSQQIVGMVTDEERQIEDLYKLIKNSYCYSDLDKNDYYEIINYLAGEYAKLEERHVYAKIWKNEDGSLKRRGKMTRVIYMTNIGTIPDETSIKVKMGETIIGTIEESFLERLKPGDIFVLGGDIYQFRYSKGTTAFVKGSISRPPTVPSWFSEQLPLSFDLANDIGRFRRLMNEYFESKANKKDVLDFINEYLYVDNKASNAIFKYMKEQYDFCKIIPNDKRILIENYHGEDDKKIVFHTLFGRKVNDCLSRAIAFSLSITQKRDVEVGINDNGFYISYEKPVNVLAVLKQITPDNIEKVMIHAIEKSEVLKRRFRHCAGRSLMILRNYMGREKNVGRQQVASMILMKVLKEINPNFPILKEAKREVLEDLMNLKDATEIIRKINEKEIVFEEIITKIPSPFAFNLILQGHLDILKMEDKIEFLKRMHSMVLAKISISNKSGKNTSKNLLEDSETVLKHVKFEDKSVEKFKDYNDLSDIQTILLEYAGKIRKIPIYFRKELFAIIKGKKIEKVNEEFIEKVREHKDLIIKEWPSELSNFIFTYINERENFDMKKYIKNREEDPNLKKELNKEEIIDGLRLVARRQKLDDDVKSELIQSVSSKIKLSEDTKKWIDGFVNGTIPKYCSDLVYQFLVGLNKK